MNHITALCRWTTALNLKNFKKLINKNLPKNKLIFKILWFFKFFVSQF